MTDLGNNDLCVIIFKLVASSVSYTTDEVDEVIKDIVTNAPESSTIVLANRTGNSSTIT